MEAADKSEVPAGGALAVDRERFSGYITEKIAGNENIRVISSEVVKVPEERPLIIATGPLTSDALAADISRLVGDRKLYFFDAAAPIVDFSSVDMEKAFFASRYGKGDADYINCPMNESEYNAFYEALVSAKCAELHSFEQGEKLTVFEGCMPVEEMARRGIDTLRFGPLKPVGITHPVTGEKYYAVVQLRRENAEGTMFNIVGFQTHLTFPEQRRVFGMIPGLENAEFLRYGVMHRNTYIDSPGFLNCDFSVVNDEDLYFAGQMTGVEGYIESASSGFTAGIGVAAKYGAIPPVRFGDETMIGAMGKYVSEGNESGDFQPMNANFGMIAPPPGKIKGGKRARYDFYSKRALDEIDRLAVMIK
jgi:methylenetetrahydrofolate--tRNA-(uracil-5-)-methyltransferase